MAQPMLVPVTLPDGRVVNMFKSPALDAAGLTAASDPLAGMSFDQVGGGGAPPMPPPGPAPMTPMQQLVANEVPLAGASTDRAHAPLPPRSKSDPLAGMSFDDVGRVGAGAQADVEDVPDAGEFAGQGRYVPGGMTPESQIVKQGAQIAPDTVKAIGEGYDAQIAAKQAERSALETAQTNAAIAAANAQQDELDALDERRSRRIAIDADIKTKNEARETANTAAEAAAVDPMRYMRDRPTWAKALAGLGMMVQGAAQRYGEGLSGQSAQPLRGAEILREAWQDDIKAQQIRYEQAKDRSDLANNRYKEAIELYGTPEAAKLALEEQHSRLAQRYLENQKQRVTDAQQLSAIDQTIAQLKTSQQEKSAELQALISDEVTTQHKNRPGYYTGGAGGTGVPGVKPGSDKAVRVSAIDQNLQNLAEADRWAAELEQSGVTKIPGYDRSLGGKADDALSHLTGDSPERGTARQHVQRVKTLVQEPLGKSDADAETAERITVGDGSPAAFRKAAAKERERLLRERQALTGQASGRAAVPGAR